VHVCTLEPDTDIVSVKLIHADATETEIGACGNVPIGPNDMLQIDFLVTDPDGHLAYYTLDATYAENLVVSLLPLLDSEPTASLIALMGGPVGPNYGDANPLRSALNQGAVAPHWYGGTFRLTVPAKLAFPETCCYQLELRAYKRTIVGSFDGYAYANLSEYSIMIVL
jgi:hypothetical protein